MLEQVFLARRLRVRQMPSELREYWSVNRLGLHRDPVLKQSNLYEEGRSEPGCKSRRRLRCANFICRNGPISKRTASACALA